MWPYVIRRLLVAIPTLAGIAVLSFALLHMAPGDPVQLLVGTQRPNPTLIEQIRRRYCLDRPVAEQFVVWLVGDWRGQCTTRGILRGDFGYSIPKHRAVLDLIGERLGATLLLTGTAMALGLLTGVLIGLASAIWRGSSVDQTARVGSALGNAIPSFWLGLVLIAVLGVRLRWFPIGGMSDARMSDGGGWLDTLRHLVLPAFVLAVGWIAITARYMRTSVLEVLGQDYIRLARAKGVPPARVYLAHTTRNALLPVITIFGGAIGTLFAGAVVVEHVFAWPGMGRLALDAVAQRDYPLLMGTVMIGAVCVVLGNLLADVLYSVVDPRVRLG